MDSQLFKRVLIIGTLALAALFFGRMLSGVDEVVSDKILIVSVEKTALYSEPNANSYKLLELEKGDKVELIADSADIENLEWINVANGPFTGYIKSAFVEKSVMFQESK